MRPLAQNPIERARVEQIIDNEVGKWRGCAVIFNIGQARQVFLAEWFYKLM